ncbi:MAG: M6 family metalloprotease domain-containing protein [Bacteroidetes bacterium]|nr:M6 family metalloprotease domain-containing protein [Bacteroidota bacterium]
MKICLRFFTSFVFIFLIFSSSLFAAWIDKIPQTVVQPDGSVISCFATGDEFWNWLHDENGFTIIQNHDDGYYYYAILMSDQLLPSSYRVDSIDPADAGLSPWTNISAEKMMAIRTDFLKNKMPEKKAIPGFNAPENVQNEGVLNNLVVYIRFSDQSEYSADTVFYHNMFNNNNSDYNSMLNYFETVSYDKISIPSWFYPISEVETVISYQDIYPRGYFMPYDPVTNPQGYQSGQSGEREHALLERACNYIEDEVPVTLNIDKDNDGYVDNMVFIIRGATTAWGTLLWPHRWALYNENVYIHGKRVWDYNLQVEDHLNGQGAGVLCHEMFHSLSAPDLYHYNSAPFSSVGPWDLMDAAGNPPQSMGAYMKYRYGGWIDQIPEITECGSYELNPLSESENNCFKIASPNSASEYYVLEYRVKEGTFEGVIPGSGLLVYRIDNNQNGNGNAQGPPDEVYVYRPDGNIYANGSLDQAHFAADYGRTEINDNTNPAPFLQNGSPGGLIISNVGYTGETISFDVYFEKEPVAEYSSSETLVSIGCPVDFTDESLCAVDSWEWTFENATPATSNEQNPQGIIWNNPGTYTVSLTVTNSWGSDMETKTGYIEVSDEALPNVVFYASDSIVCTGQVVQFTDYSEVCPLGWNWQVSPSSFEFVNGTGADSQNPEIIFNEPIEYTIALTASNVNGQSMLEKSNYIKAGGNLVDYTEDFESGSFESAGWTVNNPDDGITWEITDNSSQGGNFSAWINLFEYFSIFKRDQLISPPFDLSNQGAVILVFDHAYAQAGNLTYSDSLIVKISDDCGQTWTRIAEMAEDGSGNFATHEPYTFNFIPQVQEDWCGPGEWAQCQTIDISSWAGNEDVRIMFESVRLTGNNLFLDNIGLYIPEDIALHMSPKNEQIHIYPNPSKGMVYLNIPQSYQNSTFTLYNVMGKAIRSGKLNKNNFTMDLASEKRGLYFLHVFGETYHEVKKIIVE